MKKIDNLPTQENNHLGGGTLNKKKPLGGLEKFDKNKNKKIIIIGSLVFLLLLIGGINLYRTFALYEEKKEFNVLRGRVPKFGTQIQYYLDDVPQENAPAKGTYGVKVSCDKEVAYSWDYDEWKLNLPEGIKTITCEVKFYTMPNNFSGYIMKLSFFDDSVIGETQPETVQTPALTDYRYIGASPNNYVCLEENRNCKDEEGNTIDDKLYRIIGVIPTQSRVPSADNPNEEIPYENRVKLIKETSYGGNYTWSGSTIASSNWAASTLNTVILNQTYWNSIESYQKYIDPTKWYLGEVDKTVSNYIGKRSYIDQRGNRTSFPSSTIANIGLMYVSDYIYATSGGTTGRETCLGYSLNSNLWQSIYDPYKQCRLNDWLYNGENQWTISSYVTTAAHYTNGNGTISTDNANSASTNRLNRPTFHLNKDVEYNGGDGSYTNPYRIKLKSN